MKEKKLNGYKKIPQIKILPSSVHQITSSGSELPPLESIAICSGHLASFKLCKLLYRNTRSVSHRYASSVGLHWSVEPSSYDPSRLKLVSTVLSHINAKVLQGESDYVITFRLSYAWPFFEYLTPESIPTSFSGFKEILTKFIEDSNAALERSEDAIEREKKYIKDMTIACTSAIQIFSSALNFEAVPLRRDFPRIGLSKINRDGEQYVELGTVYMSPFNMLKEIKVDAKFATIEKIALKLPEGPTQFHFGEFLYQKYWYGRASGHSLALYVVPSSLGAASPSLAMALLKFVNSLSLSGKSEKSILATLQRLKTFIQFLNFQLIPSEFDDAQTRLVSYSQTLSDKVQDDYHNTKYKNEDSKAKTLKRKRSIAKALLKTSIEFMAVWQDTKPATMSNSIPEIAHPQLTTGKIWENKVEYSRLDLNEFSLSAGYEVLRGGLEDISLDTLSVRATKFHFYVADICYKKFMLEGVGSMESSTPFFWVGTDSYDESKALVAHKLIEFFQNIITRTESEYMALVRLQNAKDFIVSAGIKSIPKEIDECKSFFAEYTKSLKLKNSSFSQKEKVAIAQAEAVMFLSFCSGIKESLIFDGTECLIPSRVERDDANEPNVSWEQKGYEKLDLIIVTPSEVMQAIDDDVPYVRPENIAIKLYDEVGQKARLAPICYRQVEANAHDTWVIRSSFEASSRVYVIAVLKWVAELCALDASGHTIGIKIANIIHLNKFNEFKEPPSDLKEARALLERYTDHLREQVRIYRPKNKDIGQDKIGTRSTDAQELQKSAAEMLHYLLGEDVNTLTYGLHAFEATETAHTNKTQAIPENLLAAEMNFYTIFFRTIADVLLKNTKLPVKIDFLESSVWLSPSRPLVITGDKNPQNRKSNKWFNYDEGRVYSVEEGRSIGLKHASVSMRRNKQAVMEKQNEEFSSTRITLASSALKAYYMHFLCVTGMNDAPASSLKFDSDYSIEKTEDKHFRTIKWRADGKEVSVQIQSIFIDDFKKFLKLREYCLTWKNKPDFKPLFINGLRGNMTPSLRGQTGAQIRKVLQGFTPVKLSTGQELRVTKGLWVRKKHGLVASAYLLSHTPNTSMKSYSGNDSTTTDVEFGNYWEAFRENTIKRKDENTLPTNIGGCGGNHEPDFFDDAPAEFKICGKGEGGLFCSNFKVHNDETDIRKLFSVKYFMELLEPITKSKENWETVYGPIVKRIEAIISELTSTHLDTAQLCDEIEVDVYENESLSPYWAHKLEMLIDLEIIA